MIIGKDDTKMVKRKKEIRTEKKQEKKRQNRLFIVRKRQIAALSLILLIGIAGYLNLSLRQNENPSVSVMYDTAAKRLGEATMVNGEGEAEEAKGVTNNTKAPEGGYFETARMERQKKRGETVEMLTKLLNAQETDKEAKENAQAQISMLSRFSEAETASEQMIRAKGYGDCVVFMGENRTSVAVATDGLNEIDAAVITVLVASQGGIPAEQVKIVEIKPN